ncbi:hypothetical protein VKT23_015917 [Stygiomarasmius scandens]|uniref:Uncharacterized protein n=1 Tax=Marasmiellus scandens TaxID=2682957 RepID=A0ABR1J0W2_9AGAR
MSPATPNTTPTASANGLVVARPLVRPPLLYRITRLLEMRSPFGQTAAPIPNRSDPVNSNTDIADSESLLVLDNHDLLDIRRKLDNLASVACHLEEINGRQGSQTGMIPPVYDAIKFLTYTTPVTTEMEEPILEILLEIYGLRTIFGLDSPVTVNDSDVPTVGEV